jgi:DNA-binding transcriptional MerR regulator
MMGASPETTRNGVEKAPGAFRTIREVSEELGVPQHVLRFWESRFGQVRPLKRAGGRRYYRPEDVELLRRIQELLYQDGYTIRGVQKLFRDGGVKAVRAASSAPAQATPAAASLPASDIASPAEGAAHAERRVPAKPVAAEAARPREDAHDQPLLPGTAPEATLDPATRARLVAIAAELDELLALMRAQFTARPEIDRS